MASVSEKPNILIGRNQVQTGSNDLTITLVEALGVTDIVPEGNRAISDKKVTKSDS
jgi:hypothetical protein